MRDMHRIVFIFHSSVDLFLLEQTSDVQVGTPGCFSTGAGGDTCVQSQVGHLRETDYGVIDKLPFKGPTLFSVSVSQVNFGKMLNAFVFGKHMICSYHPLPTSITIQPLTECILQYFLNYGCVGGDWIVVASRPYESPDGTFEGRFSENGTCASHHGLRVLILSQYLYRS